VGSSDPSPSSAHYAAGHRDGGVPDPHTTRSAQRELELEGRRDFAECVGHVESLLTGMLGDLATLAASSRNSEQPETAGTPQAGNGTPARQGHGVPVAAPASSKGLLGDLGAVARGCALRCAACSLRVNGPASPRGLARPSPEAGAGAGLADSAEAQPEPEPEPQPEEACRCAGYDPTGTGTGSGGSVTQGRWSESVVPHTFPGEPECWMALTSG
jgi:hypothetical protein